MFGPKRLKQDDEGNYTVKVFTICILRIILLGYM